MTGTRVFVSSDTTAKSLGSDDIAAVIAKNIASHQLDVQLIRNGSRGLAWLEPLIEIDTADGRIAFGPLNCTQAADLFNTANIPDIDHPLCLGLTESLPALAMQNRITCQRMGVIDPLSLDDYLQHSGYQGLSAALALSAEQIVAQVRDSGLRGRGGAAFPVGIKWQTVLDAPAEQKYIVCNADEGDSGTFVDRLIMECDPFQLIEGMTIAALAVQAEQGYIYLRSEYPLAIKTMNHAIEAAYAAGYLGDSISNSNRRFHLEVRKAAGAYICGEETALLESLEGKRGMVRFRPPLPAIEGLFGQPTVVNNVVSLTCVPSILANGAQSYQQFGINRSRGTLTVQLAGNVKHGGLYEVNFGLTLREIIEQWGGGTASGRPIRAVQVGGPLGAYLSDEQFDLPLDYENFAEAGAILGHGGIVVFDDTVDLGTMARFSMEFCALESCGKCTPCRIGSVRGKEVIDKIKQNLDAETNRVLLRDLCQTMIDGSLCAMGSMTPNPVLSVLNHFPEDL